MDNSSLKSTGLGVAGVLAMGAGVASGISTLKNGCTVDGGSKDPTIVQESQLKNRYNVLDPEHINASLDFNALSGANQGALGDTKTLQAQGAEITGVVVDVKVGGKEACNCDESDDQSLMDTHIFVGPPGSTPSTPKKKCLVVEVTPRVRALLLQQGLDWSTPTLRSTLLGHNVKFSGWLFFDGQHLNASEADGKDRPNNWRASCWELHPVTEIEILDGDVKQSIASRGDANSRNSGAGGRGANATTPRRTRRATSPPS